MGGLKDAGFFLLKVILVLATLESQICLLQLELDFVLDLVKHFGEVGSTLGCP